MALVNEHAARLADDAGVGAGPRHPADGGQGPSQPAGRRRRVLLSSFACSSQWGSEPGVGWQWLIRLARRHEVVLVTHAYFRSHVEPALAAAGLADVEVHYFEAPAFGAHPHRQLNSWLYYTWWQWRVREVVRPLLARRRFDLVHHITWGTLRFPCFLGGLGAPLVMGPLGGGEKAPLRFFRGLPPKVRFFDALRSLTLLWVKVDPLATLGPRRSTLVLCKSKESLQALPASVRPRALVMPEIGSPPVAAVRDGAVGGRSGAGSTEFRLLFAGRLLGWKGVALAVGATALLAKDGFDVGLDVVGEGPLRLHLEDEVTRLGLQRRVRFRGAIPRDELLALYGDADLFVFPSLHDSSGNVVLEALSRGLPVVCVDLGGPQNFVDADCAMVVATAGRDRPQLERALADAIAAVLRDRERLDRMSRAAVAQAARQNWDAVVERAYGAISKRLDWDDRAGAAAAREAVPTADTAARQPV